MRYNACVCSCKQNSLITVLFYCSAVILPYCNSRWTQRRGKAGSKFTSRENSPSSCWLASLSHWLNLVIFHVWDLIGCLLISISASFRLIHCPLGVSYHRGNKDVPVSICPWKRSVDQSRNLGWLSPAFGSVYFLFMGVQLRNVHTITPCLSAHAISVMNNEYIR